MDPKKTDTYRERLLSMKKELLDTLKNRYEDAINFTSENTGNDFADDAYNLYNKNLMLGRVETDALKLRLVEQALKRLEDGTYGYCIECGDEIDEKRLKYVPFARYCTECKSELEKKGAIRM